MSTWFTADWHLGHANVLRFEPHRPWANTEEMAEALIQEYNSCVGTEDEVWFLGDFAYRCPKSKAQAWLDRLNGRKHLIMGNHDKKLGDRLVGWEDVSLMQILTLGHFRVTLCHYPLASWLGQRYKQGINLHGHSHGKTPRVPLRIDVGIDTPEFRFRPCSWDEIQQLVVGGGHD